MFSIATYQATLAPYLADMTDEQATYARALGRAMKARDIAPTECARVAQDNRVAAILGDIKSQDFSAVALFCIDGAALQYRNIFVAEAGYAWDSLTETYVKPAKEEEVTAAPVIIRATVEITRVAPWAKDASVSTRGHERTIRTYWADGATMDEINAWIAQHAPEVDVNGAKSYANEPCDASAFYFLPSARDARGYFTYTYIKLYFAVQPEPEVITIPADTTAELLDGSTVFVDQTIIAETKPAIPEVADDATNRTYKTWAMIGSPDEWHYQIEGHGVEPAYGNYYTSRGYHWAVTETRSRMMGLGTTNDTLFYCRTREQAEREAKRYAPVIGFFSA